MKLHWVILGMGAIMLPACATVNVADVGPSTSAQSSSQATTNVVLKASDKLNQEFAENGWIEPGNYTLRTAAMTLLKGQQAAKTAQSSAYAANVTPVKLRADIGKADLLASQTLKAADVYLTYVEPGSDMTLELQSLETALLTCRKAERTFTIAADLQSAGAEAELTKMATTVDQLQDTTDDYGRQVRAVKAYNDISQAPVN